MSGKTKDTSKGVTRTHSSMRQQQQESPPPSVAHTHKHTHSTHMLFFLRANSWLVVDTHIVSNMHQRNSVVLKEAVQTNPARITLQLARAQVEQRAVGHQADLST